MKVLSQSEVAVVAGAEHYNWHPGYYTTVCDGYGCGYVYVEPYETYVSTGEEIAAGLITVGLLSLLVIGAVCAAALDNH